MKQIDLRSDTVTRPDAPMMRAMIEAPTGDDVYGEDPTVNRLQERVATLLGKEAALFVPTGVMSNQLALKVLTRPGDEVIVGENSHIFNYETGAPALLSGVQLHTVPDDGGILLPTALEAARREDVYYMPRTAVIALEQTHNRNGGAVIPMDALRAVAAYARSKTIALHLDGARLWNASIASGISPATYAALFDTVSVCLSKGLGAPIGSLLAGSRENVAMALRFRKVWGGGWRQAGFLAAAGLYALSSNMERLADDHRKAQRFAEMLGNSPGITVLNAPETNILLFTIRSISPELVAFRLAERGILLSAAFKGKIRAAFHKDVSMEETERAATALIELSATNEQNPVAG